MPAYGCAFRRSLDGRLPSSHLIAPKSPCRSQGVKEKGVPVVRGALLGLLLRARLENLVHAAYAGAPAAAAFLSSSLMSGMRPTRDAGFCSVTCRTKRSLSDLETSLMGGVARRLPITSTESSWFIYM